MKGVLVMPFVVSGLDDHTSISTSKLDARYPLDRQIRMSLVGWIGIFGLEFTEHQCVRSIYLGAL
jgi:hypothetical protein